MHPHAQQNLTPFLDVTVVIYMGLLTSICQYAIATGESSSRPIGCPNTCLSAFRPVGNISEVANVSMSHGVRLLPPPFLVDEVPWHPVQHVTQFLNGLEEGQIHPEHRHTDVLGCARGGPTKDVRYIFW